MRVSILLFCVLNCTIAGLAFRLTPLARRTSAAFRISRSMSDYVEKDYTLVFCRRKAEDGTGEVLLGMKKRGFGVGKWNGFGGKIEDGESIDEGAKRELMEECSISANTLERRGFLVFKMLEARKIMRVHVFDTEHYSGEAVESEEMVISYSSVLMTLCFRRYFVRTKIKLHAILMGLYVLIIAWY
jgi:ADP-ribose pyrophosphatase YjhB (NUDIX family)